MLSHLPYSLVSRLKTHDHNPVLRRKASRPNMLHALMLKRKADILQGKEEERSIQPAEGGKRMANEQGVSDDKINVLDPLPVKEHAASESIILTPSPPAAIFDRSHARSSSPVQHTLKRLGTGPRRMQLVPLTNFNPEFHPSSVTKLRRLLKDLVEPGAGFRFPADGQESDARCP
ncbi:hypothetical protein KCU91_g11288, partial [Aureobasidium melanogenum]